MPLCEIHTNIPAGDIPADFQEKIQRFVAKTLDKKFITIRITSGLRMCRGGCFDKKLVNVDLYGGFTNRDKNREYSKEIFGFITDELSVTEESIGLAMHFVPPTHCGTGGKLISDVLDAARLKELQESS